jgi:hypothetical protein
MIITILCEPRSGSTNLANWFFIRKDFTVLYEPYNIKSEWYKNKIPPQNWEFTTEHLLIKENYSKEINYTDLLDISDKIIILYRENEDEQSLSWENAVATNNWDRPWVYEEKSKKKQTVGLDYLYDIKEGIKENYINKNYFTISYEELYYNNGFQRVVDYLNIDGVENVGFPYGQKYRINIDKPRSLI